jgi:hypothetical protein
MGCEVCRGLSRASASECVRVRKDRELRRAHVRIRRMRGETTLNYREAGSKRACGARANHNHQGRKPLGQLDMPRGDGRCACERTLSRSSEALLKGHL